MNEVILGLLLTGLVAAVAWLWLSLNEAQHRMATLEAATRTHLQDSHRAQKRSRDLQTQMQRHIARLEAEVTALKRKQDDLLMRQGVSKTFDAAVNLARKGAAPEELMESCGLSLGEADLLCRIYRAPSFQGSGYRSDLLGPPGRAAS